MPLGHSNTVTVVCPACGREAIVPYASTGSESFCVCGVCSTVFRVTVLVERVETPAEIN